MTGKMLMFRSTHSTPAVTQFHVRNMGKQHLDRTHQRGGQKDSCSGDEDPVPVMVSTKKKRRVETVPQLVQDMFSEFGGII